jgi:hypothetical protein
MQTETRSNLTALEVHVNLTWVPSSGVGHCGAQDKRACAIYLSSILLREKFSYKVEKLKIFQARPELQCSGEKKPIT